jgi:cell shape-determining protein MreD
VFKSQIFLKLNQTWLMCGLIYIMAVLCCFYSVPWSWRAWAPDVFFLVWCYILMAVEHNQAFSAIFWSWLFGLSVDFWISPFLGPFSLLYVILCFGLGFLHRRPWTPSLVMVSLVYQLMFLWMLCFRYILNTWSETWLVFHTPTTSWVMTYCLGWLIIAVQTRRQRCFAHPKSLSEVRI